MYVDLENGNVRVDMDYVREGIARLRRECIEVPEGVLTYMDHNARVDLLAPAFYGDKVLASQFLGEVDPNRDALSFVFGKFLELEHIVKNSPVRPVFTGDFDLSPLGIGYYA